MLGDHVVNLKEEIIINRIKAQVHSTDQVAQTRYLDKATKALER